MEINAREYGKEEAKQEEELDRLRSKKHTPITASSMH
jgi:hypothetical protein